jgi:hypothetical protein
MGFESADLYMPVLAFSTNSETSYPPERGPLQLLQIRYINNARRPERSASAEQVSARLVFKRKGTDVVVQQKLGAWAVGGAPTDAAPDSVSDVVDIVPNDIPARLNLAIKWPQDENAYVYVPECFRGYFDGRHPGMELPAGEYDLTIALRGLGVQTVQSFVLKHGGKDTAMSVFEVK